MKVPKMKDFVVEDDKIIFTFDEIIKPKEGVTNVDLKRQAMAQIGEFCRGYLSEKSVLKPHAAMLRPVTKARQNDKEKKNLPTD